MAPSQTVVLPEDIKIHVSKVNVSGLVRTKNDIVVEQVKPVLKASTLKEMLVESLESMQKLRLMDVFKNVSLKLDAVRGEGGGGGVVVTFHVEERGRISSTVAANAGTQSGDASMSMLLRNVFGRAEQLKMTSSTTVPNWGQTVQLVLSKPYYKDIEKKLHLSLGTVNTKLPFSGYQEYITGSSVECHAPSYLGQHTLAWGCSWRELYGFSSGVPMSIREQAGHSLKSSIKHVLESDERDDPLFPHAGYRVKMTQEVAGFGGDVFYGKAEVQSEWHRELWRDWVLSLSLWGGVLRAYSPSRINDRFLLGGPTTLRGFSMWGVGPRVKGYSVGGEAYWAAGLHLFSPLPLVRNDLLRRIRIHSFATAGNLIQCSSLSDLSSLSRDISCSCGVGVHVRLGIAQIELNYALPLKATPTDGLNPGLQFGIGLEML